MGLFDYRTTFLDEALDRVAQRRQERPRRERRPTRPSNDDLRRRFRDFESQFQPPVRSRGVPTATATPTVSPRIDPRNIRRPGNFGVPPLLRTPEPLRRFNPASPNQRPFERRFNPQALRGVPPAAPAPTPRGIAARPSTLGGAGGGFGAAPGRPRNVPSQGSVEVQTALYQNHPQSLVDRIAGNNQVRIPNTEEANRLLGRIGNFELDSVLGNRKLQVQDYLTTIVEGAPSSATAQGFGAGRFAIPSNLSELGQLGLEAVTPLPPPEAFEEIRNRTPLGFGEHTARFAEGLLTPAGIAGLGVSGAAVGGVRAAEGLAGFYGLGGVGRLAETQAGVGSVKVPGTGIRVGPRSALEIPGAIAGEIGLLSAGAKAGVRAGQRFGVNVVRNLPETLPTASRVGLDTFEAAPPRVISTGRKVAPEPDDLSRRLGADPDAPIPLTPDDAAPPPRGIGEPPPRTGTRRPPPGTPPEPPEGPRFGDIAERAIKGEPEVQTLLREHQGAIETSAREAQLLTDEVNDILRRSGLGRPLRRTVVPNPGQEAEFDELHRLLHNPSKVASGEMQVPENMRPAYERLRELTDWEEAARLDFDPNMATVTDYFYRGWKAPEGVPAGTGTGSGALGKTPGFKKPRVTASYEEMRAAGFEPLFWNPAEQWRFSRMMGVRSREQSSLIEAIKKIDIAVPHAGGPLPSGWRVPRVGPAFEGKPFAIVDEAGKPRPVFTRQWMVPDTVADRLENIYGVPPQLGKIEVAGRAIDVGRAIDAVVFVPKQAKLIASLFQHIDFLTRSHIGAWAGMVDAIRAGKPISAVKSLAAWPASAGKILRSTVDPGYRRALQRWAVSTTPFDSARPGLHMKAVSKAGLSLRDVTIFPENFDQIVRQAADEATAVKAVKAVPRALNELRDAWQRGLFEGVYPAAILTDIQNNIAPIMLRNYPNLTDAQMAAQIAKAAGIKYSTIPASMSVVQNRFLRNTLTRVFFSMGESEGLLRQASGAVRGSQAAYWRTQAIAAYLGLISVANVIHFVSTGEPLPVSRYVPISKNKFGPLPFGYNRDFAAPNIPLTGRSGTELTLDLVGQLDTAFRILDPVGFVTSRESVPVRAVSNQIKGSDFFGAPIDTVGPEGVVSRTAQAIFDLFAPIGVGQAAMELARNKITFLEPLIPPGESRAGTEGLAIQASGANVRTETTPQLLDRTRTKVMQDLNIEGPYDSLDIDEQAKVDDEVERRIGDELGKRRETADIRGQLSEGSQRFSQREEAVQPELAKIEEIDQLYVTLWKAGPANAAATAAVGRALEEISDARAAIAAKGDAIWVGTEFERDAPDDEPIRKALLDYWAIEVEDYRNRETREIDWERFFLNREQALAPLSASERTRADAYLERNRTQIEKDSRSARGLLDAAPVQYQGLTAAQDERLGEFRGEVARVDEAMNDDNIVVSARNVAIVLADDFGGKDVLETWQALQTDAGWKRLQNPAYWNYIKSHLEELRLFAPWVMDARREKELLGIEVEDFEDERAVRPDEAARRPEAERVPRATREPRLTRTETMAAQRQQAAIRKWLLGR